MSETFFLRAVDPDTGDVHETELSAGQTLDAVAELRAGRPAAIAYFPDEEPFVDEEGRLGVRDSAIPERPEAA